MPVLSFQSQICLKEGMWWSLENESSNGEGFSSKHPQSLIGNTTISITKNFKDVSANGAFNH